MAMCDVSCVPKFSFCSFLVLHDQHLSFHFEFLLDLFETYKVETEISTLI